MSMSLPPFDTIWRRIEALQGQDFTTITGLPFTYRADERALFPSRTDYRLSRRNFEKAYGLVPFPNPGAISDTVRGPSYVWAILHDPRVAQGAWGAGR